MTLVYPAIFHQDNGSFWVEFPDLPSCHSYGETLVEAMENAKEALEGYCLTVLENGKKPNPPSEIRKICVNEEGAFSTLVDCKLTKTKNVAVKKTLTIPAWLNDMAVSENINFSQTLQNALIEKLGVAE